MKEEISEKNSEIKQDKKEKQEQEKRVFMKPGRTNKEDRINFIKFWANYIRTHPDKVWSKAQNIVIDSQIPG